MNPSINPNPNPAAPPPQVPSQPVNSPPPQQPAPQPPTLNAVAPSQTQIVQAIPVHQPGQPVAPGPTMNPIAQAGPPVVHSQTEDDDLDKLLQNVNNKVKDAKQPVPKKSLLPTNKLASSKGRVKGLIKVPGKFLTAGIAVLIALGLMTAAFFAYHQTAQKTLASQPGKVGTSSDASDAIQQAGGTLVRPADLDDYASGLQTKLNSLNDSGDFGSSSLSDQNLGL